MEKIRRPLLARGHQAAKGVATYPISFFNIQSPVNQSSSLPIDKSAVHPSAGLNLLFAGLQVQVSHLVIGGSRAPWSNILPPTRRLLSAWGVPGEILKFSEISGYLQYT